jgi:hypothetical protein
VNPTGSLYWMHAGCKKVLAASILIVILTGRLGPEASIRRNDRKTRDARFRACNDQPDEKQGFHGNGITGISRGGRLVLLHTTAHAGVHQKSPVEMKYVPLAFVVLVILFALRLRQVR